MKPLLFAADLHVRNWAAFGSETFAGVNARGRRCVQVVRELCKLAAEHDAAVVIAGDVFDQHAPPPQLVAELAMIFAAHTPGVRLLVGNHDAFSDAQGDHGIGVFNCVTNTHVFSFARVEDGVLYCPFRKAPPTEWLEKELREGQGRGAKLLVAHFGMITKDKTPPFLLDAPDAARADWLDELLVRHGYEGAVLGNWHWPETYGRVHQCGTLIPQKFDGSVPAQPLLYEDGKFRRLKNLPSQPTFQTVKHGNAMRMDDNTYTRFVDVPRSDADALIEGMREQCGDRFEVEVVEREHAHRSELVVGLDPQAREEIFADYVARTFAAEPEEVRAEVLARVRGYGVP